MEAIKQAKETTAVDLGALLDDGDDAVVTLVAGETRLVAHRAVLMDRSTVFATMFPHDPLEASSGEVSIQDVEGPVLRQLLAYLYTLQAPHLPDMAAQLLVAADKYGVTGLKAACEQQVASQLSVETAAAAAVLAVRHSCGSLRQEAINFIKDHTCQVMATQGWAEAVRLQPEDVVEVSRMLADPPAESSVPPLACPTTQPRRRRRRGRPTPASAAPSTVASHQTPPPDDAAVSSMSAPAPAHSGTSHQPHSGDSRHSGTPASAAPATATSHQTPPTDDAVVSRLRSLPAEERSRRLIQAAEEGVVGELEALLAAGAYVAAREVNGYWWTALHYAAYGGHVEAVRLLVARGALVDARDRQEKTPLHWAIVNGHAAVVQQLLAASADHSARDFSGWTPLHYAANSGNREVAAALLDAGADRVATEEDGLTALDFAMECNEKELVELLAER